MTATRDEAALEVFYSELVDAFPGHMAVFAIRSNLTIAQLKMSPRILIRREQHGDLSATACLDRLETMLAEHHRRGDQFPIVDQQAREEV